MRGSVGMHSDSPHGRPSMPDQEFRFSGTEVHGHIIVPIRRTCDDANGPAGYYLIPGPITTSIARKCHSALRPGLDESSSPGEFHPQALTDPDGRLSPHPALMIQSPVVSPTATEPAVQDRVVPPDPASALRW